MNTKPSPLTKRRLYLAFGYLCMVGFLMTALGCGPSRDAVIYKSKGMIAYKGDLKLDDPDAWQDAKLNDYIIGQIDRMQSEVIRERAQTHLEKTHPELTEENPSLISYAIDHRSESIFFDLYVESDNSEYAQLYLQAWMDECIKLRETPETGGHFTLSISKFASRPTAIAPESIDKKKMRLGFRYLIAALIVIGATYYTLSTTKKRHESTKLRCL